MNRSAMHVVVEEHAALAAMLRSMQMLIAHGPGAEPQRFFDSLRAMLFYIDEFPERHHHPKETELLFPKLRALAPELQPVLERLDADHDKSQHAARELQHLLLAWELLGEARRRPFEQALADYIDGYLRHMHEEEAQVLPAARRLLSAEDWSELDAAFAAHRDPLTQAESERDPAFDRLFSRIVSRTPAPVGLGAPLARAQAG
jgi:hemerythrin-like domain-containing protein